MDTSEKIKMWLADFEGTIDAVAVDPATVKKDSFLRRAFELAFPPEGLPDEIRIKSEGKAVLLEEVISAHRPYYLASTKETTKFNTKTGEEKTNTSLVLRLKNSNGIPQVLKAHGLLRKDARLASGATPLKSGRSRGGYAQNVNLMLKMRQLQGAKLQQLEALENDSKRRGDLKMAKRYQEECRRVTQELERFGESL